ncbi:MAG: TIGR01777 family oxidoreductase [Nitrospirota bacterium]|nr:TIGR01777 family oxidoreductase [Nitrospirota bacterium]MDH5768289.1 TIGR01777 family oxidoreductase [Nitrospirota bacterium]
MRVLISGGSGFIGQCLTRYLLDKEFEVVILDRNRSRIESPHLQSFTVDLLKPELFDKKWFTGVEAVVNLSGRDIFTFWNEKNKKAIWESRITVNKNLIHFVAGLDRKPSVFVSASAVGYYGDKGDTELNESAPRGKGFLADVCGAWEEEVKKTEELGLRSVQVRTAPVLERNGGILKQVLKSFRFGFSFLFGSGNNWFSWIHMDDLVRIYHAAVTDEKLSGPVNACSPNPVRFRHFMNHLREFRKALLIPFPGWILKLILRETADVVLFSQRMVPVKIVETGFTFSYPRLRDALQEVFSR